MAISCARKFNKTKEPYTFEQMVRICVTAVIFKSTEETCRKFMDVLDKLRKDEVEKL